LRWGAIFPVAAAAGILDTAGNLLYTVSSLTGRLDVAAVLSSLYPAGTILLAVWLLRERATRGQTVGMALAIVAVVMISA
jgi:drug/metabolite transporter (DMT)-like permease